MMRRPLLLIGGAGLVGRHLRAALAGRELVVTHHSAQVPGGVALDLTDHEAIARLVTAHRPDVIVLAAADPYVERCEQEPLATRRVNVEPARTLADLAEGVGARLVVFSSEYVFDGSRGRYTESDAPGPLNEYGRQKVELEKITRSVPRHLICRTSGAFGWEPARKNFVCQLIDRVRARREFVVPADQLITPTYAPDLARAVAALIDRDLTATVHVVGPRIVARSEFASLICDAFGLDRDFVIARATDELGLGAPRPRAAGLADDALRALLGRALRPLGDALADMRDQGTAGSLG